MPPSDDHIAGETRSRRKNGPHKKAVLVRGTQEKVSPTKPPAYSDPNPFNDECTGHIHVHAARIHSFTPTGDGDQTHGKSGADYTTSGIARNPSQVSQPYGKNAKVALETLLGQRVIVNGHGYRFTRCSNLLRLLSHVSAPHSAAGHRATKGDRNLRHRPSILQQGLVSLSTSVALLRFC